MAICLKNKIRSLIQRENRPRNVLKKVALAALIVLVIVLSPWNTPH